MANSGQTYATHIRWLPPFHFFAVPVLLFNFFWSAWQAVQAPSGGAVWSAVVALALFMGVLLGRVQALSAQDRVIRLEMQQRLRAILPADLQPRVADITREQFVWLRFASDKEMPDLVRRVLAGELKTTTEIKKQVKDWQGDYLRV